MNNSMGLTKWLLWLNILGLVVGLVLGLIVSFTLHEITPAGNLAFLGSISIVAISSFNLCIYALVRYRQE